jgi:hypothetical protein
MGDKLDVTETKHGTATDISLLCSALTERHTISKNHVNHTLFCAKSPLLTEIHIPTRLEFPQVHNCTRLFQYDYNLKFASGFRDKYRGCYASIEFFKGCTNLLATDFKLLNLKGTKPDSSAGAFMDCKKLGQ